MRNHCFTEGKEGNKISRVLATTNGEKGVCGSRRGLKRARSAGWRLTQRRKMEFVVAGGVEKEVDFRWRGYHKWGKRCLC